MGVMTKGARDRLSPAMQAELANVAASFRMEQMELSDAELDVLARFVLQEISREECVALMRDLDATN